MCWFPCGLILAKKVEKVGRLSEPQYFQRFIDVDLSLDVFEVG